MKRVKVFSAFVSAIALALCLCACGSGSAGSASGGGPSAGPSSGSSAVEGGSSSGGGSSATAAGAAQGSPSGSSGFDFVDECADEHGNITLYALAELKGWQVATLLDQQGYEWSEADSAWIRQADGAHFSAYRESGAYTLDTYDEMNEKGGAIAAVGFNIVAGFEDAQAALAGNAQCVVEDGYFDGDSGMAIFYGPSMKEHLAVIGPYSESTTQIMVFSQEAVGSGMFDQLMGEQVGGSFKDVWRAVTGRDSYGR